MAGTSHAHHWNPSQNCVIDYFNFVHALCHAHRIRVKFCDLSTSDSDGSQMLRAAQWWWLILPPSLSHPFFPLPPFLHSFPLPPFHLSPLPSVTFPLTSPSIPFRPSFFSPPFLFIPPILSFPLPSPSRVLARYQLIINNNASVKYHRVILSCWWLVAAQVV